MQTFPALIPNWVAVLSCVGIAIVFVGSLFIFPVQISSTPRSEPQQPQQQHHHPRQQRQAVDRDDPRVIRQRFKGILLTSVVVPLCISWLLGYYGVIPFDLPWRTRLGLFLGRLGLTLPPLPFLLLPSGQGSTFLGMLDLWLRHLVLPLGLVGCLFLGPLVMMGLNQELPLQRRFFWREHWFFFKSWIGIRNFVVGPVAEEFIFRACMVSIMASSGASVKAMVFGLPLVFGIAHLHHGYESFVKKGRTRQALIQSILIGCFQLTYTTLFGWFATFAFLRTSSLWGPSLCHSFCNMMGLPDVSEVEYYYGPRWKWVIYGCFVLGVVGFGWGLNSVLDARLYGDEVSASYWALVAPIQ